MLLPINLHNWINENRHLLVPPISNKTIYIENQDFIVMIVGGPNSRKDYHYNEGEELFFQIEGDIVLKIIEDGVFKDISIKEGEMFLLPSKIPHCPTRPSNTIGLVIERYRKEKELDGVKWYCEKCNSLLYEEYFSLINIVNQLPIVMEKFYSSKSLRTCSNCNSVMSPP